MMHEGNPYQAPAVEVYDPDEEERGAEFLLDRPRSLPAGAGWDWYKASWRLFKAQPLMWWLCLLLVAGVFVVLGLIPLLNLLASLLFPMMAVGFANCAATVRQGRRFDIGQLFAGFSQQRNALLMLGAIYLGAYFALVLLAGLILGGSGFFQLMTGTSDPDATATLLGGAGAIVVLVVSLLSMLIYAVVVFASYIVFEFGKPVGEALRMGLSGLLSNVPASIVAAIVGFFLCIAATIPMGLGWLVLMPMMVLMPWVVYRDVFVEIRPDDA